MKEKCRGIIFYLVSEIKHKAEKMVQSLTVFLYSLEDFQEWEVPLSNGSHVHSVLGKLWNVRVRIKEHPPKRTLSWQVSKNNAAQMMWEKMMFSSIQTVEQVLCHWPQWQKIKLNPIKGEKPSILVSPAGTWKLLSVWKNGRALEKMEVSVLMTMFAPPGGDGSLF